MDHDQAYTLLTKYLHNKNLVKHSLAAEAAMKAIYQYLYKDKPTAIETTAGEWGTVGLLHDIDYEIAQQSNQLDKHGLLIFEPDKEPDTLPSDIAHAIKSHNYEKTQVMPESPMDWAIFCADQLTGLIVAGALVHPDKKLASLTPDYIFNRFNEKSFARGARRESILLCEEKLGIPLKEFIGVVLSAMQGIHEELGL
jgi:uncharacterized protein